MAKITGIFFFLRDRPKASVVWHHSKRLHFKIPHTHEGAVGGGFEIKEFLIILIENYKGNQYRHDIRGKSLHQLSSLFLPTFRLNRSSLYMYIYLSAFHLFSLPIVGIIHSSVQKIFLRFLSAYLSNSLLGLTQVFESRLSI